MKRKLLVLVAVIMVLSMMLIPALAVPPGNAAGEWTYTVLDMDGEEVGCNTVISMTDEGTFDGTFVGTETEDGMVVIHCNGKWSFKGNLSFEGTVNGSQPGTMEMRIVGTSSDGTLWQGTWVILSGTEGLATLRGQGTWWGPGGHLEYAGNYHFEPD